MDQYFQSETVSLIIQTSVLLGSLIVVYVIYRLAFAWFRRKLTRTKSTVDEYILDLFRGALLWFLYWFILNISTRVLYNDLKFYPVLLKINNLLLIFTVTWLFVQFINALAYYLQTRYDLSTNDNLRARKSLTQVKVFKAIAVSIIVIIAIGAALMTFEQARKAGISILTSAGIIGIIVGLAAQKSIGMILSGMQLAITQPIRLDDVVIIEGEFGKIEEIQLTYVVVRVWDEKRMIVPVTWFLEKPFHNLTRTNASTTGTIFLFVDYQFPVESLRKILPLLLVENNNWDGRIANIQVTDTTERFKEVRILLSSTDSSKNWDLRTNVREKLIDFINANYPDAFAKIKIRTV